MSDQTPPTTKRKRGAPPGNQNARTHGFYAKKLAEDGAGGISRIKINNLKGEAAMLKDYLIRLYQQGFNLDDPIETAAILRALSIGSVALTRVIETHHKHRPCGSKDVEPIEDNASWFDPETRPILLPPGVPLEASSTPAPECPQENATDTRAALDELDSLLKQLQTTRSHAAAVTGQPQPSAPLPPSPAVVGESDDFQIHFKPGCIWDEEENRFWTIEEAHEYERKHPQFPKEQDPD